MEVDRKLFDQFKKYVKDYEHRIIELEYLIQICQENPDKRGSFQKKILVLVGPLEQELRVLFDFFIAFEKDLDIVALKIHESMFRGVNYKICVRDFKKYEKETFSFLEAIKKDIETNWADKNIFGKLKGFTNHNHQWIKIFNEELLKIKFETLIRLFSW